ncbi:hypothetical protein JOD57_000866 [Geodermatophilus bullaregiensis]|uniref:S8 family serine peptidase n=1 Tax=Geodermatophilus bullaregiensis TaxID=1564160 RepID=UPI00195BA287|nr:S8 family serine peptidase [Geodermatophilus bullaregiensis]MBM7805029.1 hypothetical protein [Geodermatophilus bullaregiensis]
MSIEPGEVVRRGTVISVRARGGIAPDAVGGVVVPGQRVTVTPAGDGAAAVSTEGLPLGAHVLRIGEVNSGRDDDGDGDGYEVVTVPFVLVDTPAPVPDDVVVHHAVRLRIGELDVERLPMAPGDGPFVDVFKAARRGGDEPVQLAFDDRGEPVDIDRLLAGVAARRAERFGRVHPHLDARVRRLGADDPVPVAVWLHASDAVEAGKSEDEPTLQPTRAEQAAREEWVRLGERFAAAAGEVDFEAERIDDAAPVLFGWLPASRVAALADRPEVAAVFLHEVEGIEDLADSIAIANADDAHAAGATGRGVNVAVFEDGPDSTTDLVIAARFRTDPATSDHSRHTHGIIRNKRPGAPHGHAPDCSLHSANSKDLAAIRWAAIERGCTVISQSFHRTAEQSSSELSFDDVYKDHLALHWPYPTICEAAGNGLDSEFVNHKGFNRLTVGNHDDQASAMSSTSVFGNPVSMHGDRELPELAANGTAVTAVGLTKSGTSMAAPAVAGGAALIQQTAPLLRSWPEGCRAILLASAWRNPSGGTWRADLVAGIDAADGSGALDSSAAVQIARHRERRGGDGSRRGWDVGTMSSADVDRNGFTTSTYRVTVPRVGILRPRVKVALAWNSHIRVLRLLGLSIPLSSHLTVDLDLHVRDSAGATVATSTSWDNSYEIAEFAARPGQTYEIRIRRWSGTEDVWFGIAWTVTGLDVLLDRVRATGVEGLSRR